MKVSLKMFVSCWLLLVALIFATSINTKVVLSKKRSTSSLLSSSSIAATTISSLNRSQNVTTGRFLNVEEASTGITSNVDNSTTTAATTTPTPIIKSNLKWPTTVDSWKGYFIPAFIDSTANETFASSTTSTTTEGFSTLDNNPVFPRVLYETTTTVIPPIYRATYLKKKQQVSTSPRSYSVQLAPADDSDYVYYPSYSTETPTTTTSTSVPYDIYPSSYASVGKSYGGSGGSSPSSAGHPMYSSMGMSGGMSGMGGAGYGAVPAPVPAPALYSMPSMPSMPSYGPSYGSMHPPSAPAPMMMYGSYGSSGSPPMMYGAPAPPGGHNFMPANDELGVKGFLNKLLALLPVGLLLAVALPSLVVVPSKRSLSDENVSSSLARKTLSESYPVLDMINYYGIQSFQDEKCFRHVLCKTIRLGSQDGANVFQKQLWTAINWMDNTLAKSIGIEELWKAIIKDQCSLFSCKHRRKNNGVNETSTPPL